MPKEICLSELLQQASEFYAGQGEKQAAEFLSVLFGSIAYTQAMLLQMIKEEHRADAGETLAAYTLNALTRMELQGLDVPYSKFVKRTEIDDVMIRNEIDN